MSTSARRSYLCFDCAASIDGSLFERICNTRIILHLVLHLLSLGKRVETSVLTSETAAISPSVCEESTTYPIERTYFSFSELCLVSSKVGSAGSTSKLVSSRSSRAAPTAGGSSGSRAPPGGPCINIRWNCSFDEERFVPVSNDHTNTRLRVLPDESLTIRAVLAFSSFE